MTQSTPMPPNPMVEQPATRFLGPSTGESSRCLNPVSSRRCNLSTHRRHQAGMRTFGDAVTSHCSEFGSADSGMDSFRRIDALID
jgi:hypothetical protein